MKLPPSFYAALVLLAGFYAWTVTSDGLAWNYGKRQTDYYNLLVDGFLAGQLNLKTEVSPELLAVRDPWDPAQRPPGSALHDASLYQGKYYIYHGVVPAVLLLLPWHALAGTGLPLGAAVLVFTCGSACFALLLLADVRRRFFPATGEGIALLVGLLAGLASFAPILLRRHSMYDLPISCGQCCSLAAIWCLYRAMLPESRRLAWLAGASLAWGLAIGSRPTYLLAPATLFIVLWPLLRAAERRRWWPALAAAFGPIAAVGVLLALYNYLRFGKVSEFGVNYILSGVYESKIEHFQLRYLPWNLYAYFVSGAEWSRYFPFFRGGVVSLPLPRQHFGMDFPIGILREVPFFWLAAATPLAWRGEEGAAPLRRLLLILAWAALATAAIVLGFYAAMARYLGDMAPTLALLACLGALALHARWSARPAKLATGTLIAVAGLVSIFTIGAISVRIYDRIPQFNPALYQRLARVANAPMHWLDHLRGAPAGPVTLQVSFPARPPGTREVLLSTGWSGQRDRVLVHSLEGGQIAVGYEHAGAPEILSAPFSPDRASPQTIRLALGSLWPPATEPRLAALPAAQQAQIFRRVRIEYEGRVLLDRHQRFYDASPGCVYPGGAPDETRFSGPILSVTRAPLDTALQAASAVTPDPLVPVDADGTVHLRIRFPANAAGRRDPVIVSGETGRGDFLVAEYLADGRLRFLLDHWGSSPTLSPPLAYDAAHEYRLDVRHATYAAHSAAGGVAAATPLRLTLDGQVIWEAPVLFYPVEPDDIFVGQNPIGGSSCGERFSGTISVAASSVVR